MRATVARVTAWFAAHGFTVDRVKSGVGFRGRTAAGKTAWPFFASDRPFWADLYHLSAHPPFEVKERRWAILEALRGLPGAEVKANNPQGFPGVVWAHAAPDEVWAGVQALAASVKRNLQSD